LNALYDAANQLAVRLIAIHRKRIRRTSDERAVSGRSRWWTIRLAELLLKKLKLAQRSLAA
jgi:hypothetical protein